MPRCPPEALRPTIALRPSRSRWPHAPGLRDRRTSLRLITPAQTLGPVARRAASSGDAKGLWKRGEWLGCACAGTTRAGIGCAHAPCPRRAGLSRKLEARARFERRLIPLVPQAVPMVRQVPEYAGIDADPGENFSAQLTAGEGCGTGIAAWAHSPPPARCRHPREVLRRAATNADRADVHRRQPRRVGQVDRPAEAHEWRARCRGSWLDQGQPWHRWQHQREGTSEAHGARASHHGGLRDRRGQQP